MDARFLGVDFVVWMFCAYALILVGVGYGLDLMAKRTSQQSTAKRNFGFHYHENQDAWLCSEDQWLWPAAFDRDNRVMHYRASSIVCNTCQVKNTCTTSMMGREITREVDPWPYSESGRFHRGIALAVAVSGLVLVAGVAIIGHSPVDIAVEVATAVIVGGASIPLARHLMRTPAGFEEPTHVKVVDATEIDTAVLADRFAQKWGNVSDERKKAAALEREKVLADNAPATGWRGRGARETPLHISSALAMKERLKRESRGSEVIHDGGAPILGGPRPRDIGAGREEPEGS